MGPHARGSSGRGRGRGDHRRRAGLACLTARCGRGTHARGGKVGAVMSVVKLSPPVGGWVGVWGNQTNQARRGTWRLRASTDGLGLLGVVGRARMLVAVSVP